MHINELTTPTWRISILLSQLNRSPKIIPSLSPPIQMRSVLNSKGNYQRSRLYDSFKGIMEQFKSQLFWQSTNRAHFTRTVLLLEPALLTVEVEPALQEQF